YYSSIAALFDGAPAVISRTGYTGEDGCEIIVEAPRAQRIWELLIKEGGRPAGLAARDTLRLEAAMPLYGHELTEAINPFQAGLGWAVKLDKGEFIGRPALQAAAQDTTRPVRVGLEVEGKRAARKSCAILGSNTTPIGKVTSGSFCPWLEKSLAMGYVEPRLAAPATKLLVDIRGSATPASVVPLPFYKRKK